jgi:hypothetical protein
VDVVRGHGTVDLVCQRDELGLVAREPDLPGEITCPPVKPAIWEAVSDIVWSAAISCSGLCLEAFSVLLKLTSGTAHDFTKPLLIMAEGLRWHRGESV